jgi:hypothetical protein
LGVAVKAVELELSDNWRETVDLDTPAALWHEDKQKSKPTRGRRHQRNCDNNSTIPRTVSSSFYSLRIHSSLGNPRRTFMKTHT